MATDILIYDITPRIQYTGDGTQTAFTYPFPIFADGDIEVYLDDTLKTITTDYTVAGAGDSAGGTVTILAAPLSGIVVTLLRNIPIKRTTDFQEGGEFRAKVINDELDKMTAGLQQVEVEAGRGLKLSPTDTATSVTLPDKATRLGKLLGFNAVTGDPEATAGVAGPTGATGADGVFSGSEATVTPTALDKLALLDQSDSDNPKFGTVQSILDLVPTPTTVDVIARESLALNFFLDAVDHARVYSSMVDGVVDAFTDETGVDTGTSTNETYDATNDLYNNPSAPTLLSGATGTNLGNMTESGGLAAAFDGTTTHMGAAAAVYTGTTGYVGKDWGSSVTKSIDHIDAWPSSDSGFTSTASTGVKLTLQGSTDNFSSSVVTLATLTFTETTSGPVTVTASDLTAYRYHRLVVEADDASSTQNYCSELDFYETGAALSMTLQSNAFASSVTDPTTGHIVLFEEDVDAVTLNTDLVASVSRDGGTTWTAATLVLQGTYATGKNILTAEVDISAQPAGTSMKWKLVTANAKDMKIHGAALQWRV
ncbi:MAG: hypothetical protein HOI33_08145 [Rhodospirillaceae bacterium]|jgi:hypothetical protein|nr:hypothetical protein [Rhodospirillaceae bacterium]MBT5752665.1 hypothetical protein [Rhodospirillaceae bacterium]